VGAVRGAVAKEERGKSGFGFDPIFIPSGYDQTYAELGLDIKNKISHRRKALEEFEKYLKSEEIYSARTK
jgi:XTP/dITP diphosphohydrolase